MTSDTLEKDVNWMGSPMYDAERINFTGDGLVRGEAKPVSHFCQSLLQLLIFLLEGCRSCRAWRLGCPITRWRCAAKAESPSCPNGELHCLTLTSFLNVRILDCYRWYYRNWSLRWIGSCSSQWRSRRFATRLRRDGPCRIFHGSGPWRNDNTFPCLWFIRTFLLRRI